MDSFESVTAFFHVTEVHFGLETWTGEVGRACCNMELVGSMIGFLPGESDGFVG